MNIPVVYAMDSEGCGPRYTLAALRRLGHEARRLTPEEYFAADPAGVDLFWCQDSGAGIDFRQASPAHLRKTAAWFWDSRWNRLQRSPGDDEMTALISQAGGWVFQAQSPDVERLARTHRLERVSWLPIGADVITWSAHPLEDKIYPLSFVGNCYDPGRGAALNFAREQLDCYWPGPNSVYGAEAARVYRQSWVVWHAPTFYQLPHDVTGERVDYDLTMRLYEAAACGVPVITPPLPDFGAVGFRDGEQIFLYHSIEDMPRAYAAARARAQEPGCAEDLVAFAARHTYEHRLEHAFYQLRLAGVLKNHV